MLQPDQVETPATKPFPVELLVWLSPAFPVGGFAYSQGLETASARGHVSASDTLREWLIATLRYGALRNDLIIQALIMRSRNAERMRELAELSAALQPSRERWEEATVQARAFQDAYLAGWSREETSAFDALRDVPMSLAVAVAIAAREHDLPRIATLEAFALAFLCNLTSAAIRLSVIGQFDAQRLLSELLPAVRQQCHDLSDAGEDELGTSTFVADLACLQHETQNVRLFRS